MEPDTNATVGENTLTEEATFREVLEAEIRQTGLGEQADQLAQISARARDAELSMKRANQQLGNLTMAVRQVNALRLGVQQTSRAIRNLNPSQALYAFLNIIQVIRLTTRWLRILQKEQQKTIFQQTLLNLLSGTKGWAIIAGAIVGAGVITAAIEGSMQRGGLVRRAGLYYLHPFERVLPAHTVNQFGPFSMTVQEMPGDPEAAMRSWAIQKGEEMRRGGGIY